MFISNKSSHRTCSPAISLKMHCIQFSQHLRSTQQQQKKEFSHSKSKQETLIFQATKVSSATCCTASEKHKLRFKIQHTNINFLAFPHHNFHIYVTCVLLDKKYVWLLCQWNSTLYDAV